MRIQLFAVLFASVWAHEVHVPDKANADDGATLRPAEWDDWHMAAEHHVDQWDAATFFKLHDVSDKGYWDQLDILYIYGLAKDKLVGDGLGMGQHDHGHETVSAEDKARVVSTVLALMSTEGDGKITPDQFAAFVALGKHLPDFGFGQGHHLDFEAEYEDHHWNQYHRDADPDVLVKHKEDIEHELLHHFHEIDEAHDEAPEIREYARTYQSPIKVENIKAKYRRN